MEKKSIFGKMLFLIRIKIIDARYLKLYSHDYVEELYAKHADTSSSPGEQTVKNFFKALGIRYYGDSEAT